MDPHKTMICLAHDNNTVDKNVLNDERYIFGNLFGIIPDKYMILLVYMAKGEVPEHTPPWKGGG